MAAAVESGAVLPLPASERWRFTLEIDRPARLPEVWGSKIEGLYGDALEARACGMPSRPACGACPLSSGCELAGAYHPRLWLPAWRGGDPPRPLRFQPVAEGVGEVIFDVTVYGSARTWLDGVMQRHVAREMVGRELGSVGARVTGATVTPVAETPLHACDPALAAQWRVRVVTPTQLMADHEHELARALVSGAVRRLSALHEAYGERQDADFGAMIAQHADLEVVDVALRAVNQPRAHGMLIRGVVGELTLRARETAAARAALTLIARGGRCGIGPANHFGAGDVRVGPAASAPVRRRRVGA